VVPRRSVRQPGYLPYIESPLGFASPPHDGFAFSQRTRGCAYLQAHSPETLATIAHYTGESQPCAIRLGGILPQGASASALLCVTLSLMPALLPRDEEFRMNSWRNHLELRQLEVLVDNSTTAGEAERMLRALGWGEAKGRSQVD
jgi:hypothetical protein